MQRRNFRMQVCGVIAEYNPFHNGHLYQLDEAKKASQADYMIVIMSGMFTQRGEPALVDKFARARMALEGGADLVLELPCGYALQPAEYFAMGATRILDGLGIINHLCYGTEASAPEAQALIHDYVHHFSEDMDQIKTYIQQGIAYPEACILAYQEQLHERAPELAPYIDALRKPNAILEVTYLTALKRLSSPIVPLPIPRISVDYHDTTIRGKISSATSIRRAIFENQPWQQAVPKSTLDILSEHFRHCEGPLHREDLFPALLHCIATSSYRLPTLPDMSEELTNCILKAVPHATSFENLVDRAKTRRFTSARVSRALMALLLSMTHGDIELFRRKLPAYARVLAFKKEASELLSSMVERASIPVITQLAQYKPTSPGERRLMDLDITATNLYYLCGMDRPDRYNWDYRQRLITL